MSSEFLDSNILVYAFTTDRRAAAARALLGKGCVISVQGLNEFANVARRKLGMTWAELGDALAAIRMVTAAVHSLTLDTHLDALRIAERYGYALFDALIIASALGAGCSVLWSEDMQHGTVIDGRLRIENPFIDTTDLRKPDLA